MEQLRSTVHAPRRAIWGGVTLIVLVGAIHLLYAPGYFAIAAYLGALFYATTVGSVLVACGILRGARTWGWSLGMLLVAGAFTGYVASRTIGLPMFPVQPWGDPFGLTALLAEALFFLLAWTVLRADRHAPARPVQALASPPSSAPATRSDDVARLSRYQGGADRARLGRARAVGDAGAQPPAPPGAMPRQDQRNGVGN